MKEIFRNPIFLPIFLLSPPPSTTPNPLLAKTRGKMRGF